MSVRMAALAPLATTIAVGLYGNATGRYNNVRAVPYVQRPDGSHRRMVSGRTPGAHDTRKDFYCRSIEKRTRQ